MHLSSIPRASERRPLSLLVKSRVRSREVYVDLIDISEGGCKIRAKPGFAALGDRVVMKVNGINAPLGLARAFLQALHLAESKLEHIKNT